MYIYIYIYITSILMAFFFSVFTDEWNAVLWWSIKKCSSGIFSVSSVISSMPWCSCLQIFPWAFVPPLFILGYWHCSKCFNYYCYLCHQVSKTLCSLAKSSYLTIVVVFFSYTFNLWSSGTTRSTRWQVIIIVILIIIIIIIIIDLEVDL